MDAKPHIDFETRSACDLKRAGVHRYAEHPATEILCMAWCIGDGPVHVWTPGDPDPEPLLTAIRKGALIGAHNAAFEATLWQQTLLIKHCPHWPQLPITQFDCTMARAAACSWPQDMDSLARVIGLTYEKDKEGSVLMRRMCKPRAPRKGEPEDALLWHELPEQLERLKKYCAQDVIVERAIDKRLPPLSKSERKVWELDQTINRRGVGVDLVSVAHARRLLDVEAAKLDEAMRAVTEGSVEKTSKVRALALWLMDMWLLPNLGTDDKGRRIVAPVTKAVIKDLLSQQIPDYAREALETRKQGGMASVKKLKAMQDAASSDSRIRGMFRYCGAGTGRWSGTRVQLQNILRPLFNPAEIEEMIAYLPNTFADELLEIGFGPVIRCLGSCVRAMLVAAPGYEFIGGDFSNIEGRVLAWMTGEQWKVDAFRAFDEKRGPDAYKLAYASSFGIRPEDVSDDQRQIGKVQELALGYQGGVGAFRTMGANYGVIVLAEGETAPHDAKQVLTEAQADEIKTAWRAAHPNVRAFWYEMQELAIAAVLNPRRAQVSKSKQVKYICNNGYLCCQLPSQRVLAYPRPSVRDIEHPKTLKKRPTLHYEGEDPKTKRWSTLKAYGGLLVENIVQAVSRDLLVGAMQRMEAHGWPVVLHVHDEARCEVPVASVDLKEVAAVMAQGEPWSTGLPIAIAVSRSKRYQK
jgi:DNA polymerase